MATERIEVLTPPNSRFVNKAVKARTAGKAKRRRLVLLIALLSAAVLWPVLAWAGAHLLIVKSELVSADAMVVMSGSATYRERAAWAAKLYREGRAPIVILTNDSLKSGWNNKEQRNLYFYELAARELQQQSVRASKIHVGSGIALWTY